MAMTRVTFRGKVLNKRTVAMILAAEKILGATLTLFQGSYNAGGVAASAGTHDGGGAVDVWCAVKTPAQVVRALRIVGFAAWHRTPEQGPWGHHIHAIAIGDAELSAGARAQVADYYAGRNGLANHAPDDGPKVTPIRTFEQYQKSLEEKTVVTPLPVHVIDWSHYQANASLAAVKKAGVLAAYFKATEGDGWTDPTYVRRRREAKALGLVSGAYHFARPAVGDAAAEAQHFVKVADVKAGDLRPALDLEDRGTLTTAELTTWVLTFAATVKKLTGADIVVYTPFDLGPKCAQFPLWVARYNNANEAPRIPAPWSDGKGAALRQFSNGEYGVPSQVAGIRCDLNTLPGGPASLAALRVPGARHKGTKTVKVTKRTKLAGLAASLGVALSALLGLNPGTTGDTILKPGTEVTVPAKPKPTTPAGTPTPESTPDPSTGPTPDPSTGPSTGPGTPKPQRRVITCPTACRIVITTNTNREPS